MSSDFGLRDQLDEAREEIRQLKERLRDALAPRVVPAWVGLRLSPAERFCLTMLADTPDAVVSVERLRLAWQAHHEARGHERMATSNSVKVVICRLRDKLGPFGVTIQTVYGFGGYCLTPESKARLTELRGA